MDRIAIANTRSAILAGTAVALKKMTVASDIVHISQLSFFITVTIIIFIALSTERRSSDDDNLHTGS